MSDAVEKRGGRFARRLWCGLFGAILGGLIGLVLAGEAHVSLVHGVLLGALIGAVFAFFLGLVCFEIFYWWW